MEIMYDLIKLDLFEEEYGFNMYSFHILCIDMLSDKFAIRVY